MPNAVNYCRVIKGREKIGRELRVEGFRQNPLFNEVCFLLKTQQINMIILRNRTLRILLLMVEMSSLQLSLSRNMDPYKTLGVSRHASKSEIRKIYHAHCLFYHPDKHTQRPAKEREKYEKGFKQVQEAYNTIRSVESKEQHTCKDFDRRPTIPGMSLKSIYVQKVKIPLGKLYEGCSFQFEVRDNLWMRYRAAIRGRFIFFLSLIHI